MFDGISDVTLYDDADNRNDTEQKMTGHLAILTHKTQTNVTYHMISYVAT